MLHEPTTLSAAASAIAEAAQAYGIEPRALFRKAGIDINMMLIPGSRYTLRSMTRLWHVAQSETGDPCFGLVAGQKIRPPAMHALGLSWLASATVLEGLQRIERYSEIVSTALAFRLSHQREIVKISRLSKGPQLHVADAAIDASMVVIVKMCRAQSNEQFSPRLLALRHADHGHADRYIACFSCPVRFGNGEDALCFDSVEVQAPLPAGNRELALQNDRIAERYLASLDPGRVQDKVRELLITLLPSGRATQKTVAAQLHRSVSALQRELTSEGTSYREILAQTRQSLALQLLMEGHYSISQIAYLLGFSDQATFSRAFKRWTARSPAAVRRQPSEMVV